MHTSTNSDGGVQALKEEHTGTDSDEGVQALKEERGELRERLSAKEAQVEVLTVRHDMLDANLRAAVRDG